MKREPNHISPVDRSLFYSIKITIAWIVALREKKEGLEVPVSGISSPFYSYGYISKDLALTDPKHLGPTCGTYTLSCWFTILHGYGLGVLHFPFGTAFHTVCLHYLTSTFRFTMNHRPFGTVMSIASANRASWLLYPLRGLIVINSISILSIHSIVLRRAYFRSNKRL